MICLEHNYYTSYPLIIMPGNYQYITLFNYLLISTLSMGNTLARGSDYLWESLWVLLINLTYLLEEELYMARAPTDHPLGNENWEWYHLSFTY